MLHDNWAEHSTLQEHHVFSGPNRTNSEDKDWDGRLNNDNLISLCGRHHEMAEAGKISQAELKEIARQQEDEM